MCWLFWGDSWLFWHNIIIKGKVAVFKYQLSAFYCSVSSFKGQYKLTQHVHGSRIYLYSYQEVLPVRKFRGPALDAETLRSTLRVTLRKTGAVVLSKCSVLLHSFDCSRWLVGGLSLCSLTVLLFMA